MIKVDTKLYLPLSQARDQMETIKLSGAKTNKQSPIKTNTEKLYVHWNYDSGNIFIDFVFFLILSYTFPIHCSQSSQSHLF